jgi:hypothetical protein
VQRPEPGRRGQNDHVAVGLQQVFVSIQADELPLFGHIDSFRVLAGDAADGALHAVGKGIGDGDELHAAAAGIHRLDCRPGAAAAAPDKADLDFIAAESMSAEDRGLAGRNRAAGNEQRRVTQERPPGSTGRIGRLVHDGSRSIDIGLLMAEEFDSELDTGT